MKKMLLAMLLSVCASAHATDWDQYVTIRKTAPVCRTVTALQEIKKRFGAALEDMQDQSVKTYLAQSGCFRAQNEERVHVAFIEFGRAQVDAGIKKGFVPIVWLTPGNEKEYGIAFTSDLRN